MIVYHRAVNPTKTVASPSSIPKQIYQAVTITACSGHEVSCQNDTSLTINLELLVRRSEVLAAGATNQCAWRGTAQEIVTLKIVIAKGNGARTLCRIA